MWIIKGKHQGREEEIDQAETEEEIDYMLAEYRIAFGPGWLLWKKEKKKKGTKQ